MRFQEQDEYEAYVELPNIRQKGSPSKKKLKPIVANLVDTQYEVVEEVCWELDYHLVCEKEHKNWDIKWTDGAVSVDILNKMQSHQKINHFPGMNTLSRKNNLAKNILKMQYKFPEHYSFIPKTFLLPQDSALLRTYYNDSRRKDNIKTFIVKPEASCQGRGIFLSQDLAEIQCYGQCVVQTYVDNPLLYKGLKFDMRIYALISGCDPLRIHIYNEGLVRFATEKYEKADQQNLDNLFMHLTNYAINKDSPKYVFNESVDNLSLGHKKSLAEFFQTLKSLGLPAHEYWTGIKDTIVKTIISGQPHLQHQYRVSQPHNLNNNMCFEILGFDFMIDDRNKLYLLQINYTPSFSTQTPLDHLIKSNLIRDTLVLMNVSPQARNQAQKIAKEELDRRVYTGKIMKLTPDQRERLILLNQAQRDEHQMKNLGSFERIYPSRNTERQNKYQKLLQFSCTMYKQMSSPQKGNPRRSNSKYRIKRIISNHTTCQQQQFQNQSPKINRVTNLNQIAMNPEFTDKKASHSKMVGERGLICNNQLINHSMNSKKQTIQNINEFKPTNNKSELHEMDIASLKTRNEQLTMFSRQFISKESHLAKKNEH